jgi:hypothetical protein
MPRQMAHAEPSPWLLTGPERYGGVLKVGQKSAGPRRALQARKSLRVSVTAIVTILKNAFRFGRCALAGTCVKNRRESKSSSRLWTTTSLHPNPPLRYAEIRVNTYCSASSATAIMSY